MSDNVDLTIHADADWTYAFWLLDGNQPVNLTGKRVELWILPEFNYPTPIRTLNSLTDGEIIVDNAVKGSAHVSVTQTNVAAHITVGSWKYFLRVVNSPSDVKEYQRGTLNVLAGRTS